MCSRNRKVNNHSFISFLLQYTSTSQKQHWNQVKVRVVVHVYEINFILLTILWWYHIRISFIFHYIYYWFCFIIYFGVWVLPPGLLSTAIDLWAKRKENCYFMLFPSMFTLWFYAYIRYVRCRQGQDVFQVTTTRKVRIKSKEDNK